MPSNTDNARMRTPCVYQRHHDPMTGAHPLDDPADAAALARYADSLAAAVDAALPAWVDRSVRRVLAAQGIPVDDGVARAIEAAAAAARAEGMPRLRTLLATDIDDQRTNPLAVLRSLVRHPTAVLRSGAARGRWRGTSSVSAASRTTPTTSARPRSRTWTRPCTTPAWSGARPRRTSTWPGAAARGSGDVTHVGVRLCLI